MEVPPTTAKIATNREVTPTLKESFEVVQIDARKCQATVKEKKKPRKEESFDGCKVRTNTWF